MKKFLDTFAAVWLSSIGLLALGLVGRLVWVCMPQSLIFLGILAVSALTMWAIFRVCGI